MYDTIVHFFAGFGVVCAFAYLFEWLIKRDIIKKRGY